MMCPASGIFCYSGCSVACPIIAHAAPVSYGSVHHCTECVDVSWFGTDDVPCFVCGSVPVPVAA